MKKVFLTAIIFILTANFACANSPQKPPGIKGMHYVTIPAGVFLKAVMQSEVSTKTNNLNDPVSAIIPTNFYLTNTICIPQNSILDGSIIEFALPKKGRDGLFRIHFDKITFPENDTTYPFNEDLWMDGSDLIGGKPSQLDSMQQIPFYVEKLPPYILMKPTGEYKIGKHITVSAGYEMLIKVNSGVKLNFME